MPRDAVSRTANVGTVGKSGLDNQSSVYPRALRLVVVRYAGARLFAPALPQQAGLVDQQPVDDGGGDGSCGGGNQ